MYIYSFWRNIFSNGKVIILRLWPNVRTKVISMFQFKPLDAIRYPFNCDLVDLVLKPFMEWLWAMISLCIDNMYNLFKTWNNKNLKNTWEMLFQDVVVFSNKCDWQLNYLSITSLLLRKQNIMWLNGTPLAIISSS